MKYKQIDLETVDWIRSVLTIYENQDQLGECLQEKWALIDRANEFLSRIVEDIVKNKIT